MLYITASLRSLAAAESPWTRSESRIRDAGIRGIQGDLIAVFENDEVLVVLWPRSEGGYLIVGDAYIEEAPGISHSIGAQSWNEIGIF